MKFRKMISLITAIPIIVMSCISRGVTQASSEGITTLGDIPAAWPTVIVLYTDGNGKPILDIAKDVNPIDVDIASGIIIGYDVGHLDQANLYL